MSRLMLILSLLLVTLLGKTGALQAQLLDLDEKSAALIDRQRAQGGAVTVPRPAQRAGAASAAAGGEKGSGIAQLLGLTTSDGDSLALAHTAQNADTGLTTYHFEQQVHGVPLWGQRITVTVQKDDSILRLGGQALVGAAKAASAAATASGAMAPAVPRLTPDDAIAKLEKDWPGAGNMAVQITRRSARLVYYPDPKSGEPVLAYEVRLFGSFGPEPVAPVGLVNAQSGAIILQFSDVHRQSAQTQMATGPGGNQRYGCFQYGQRGTPPLEVTVVDARRNLCALRTRWFITENLNNEVVDGQPRMPSGRAHTFPCGNSAARPSNGACGPLNDVHAFAHMTRDMFVNWYRVDPTRGRAVIIGAHWGRGFANAVAQPSNFLMVFGDGDDRMHPFSSIDSIGHEFAHILTGTYSGLINRGQSGALNESFSDMTGEAAEYYYVQTFGSFTEEERRQAAAQGASGSGQQATAPPILVAPHNILRRKGPDFLVSGDEFKRSGRAMRWMGDPERDGRSIAHISYYHEGMDPHHSSGLFNRAFWVLSHRAGWNVRKAYHPFVVANTQYWTPNETFLSAARKVMLAARDLNLPTIDVQAAFAAIGIEVQ